MFVDVDLSDLSIVEGNLEKEEVNNIDEQNKNNEILTHPQCSSCFKSCKSSSSQKCSHRQRMKRVGG